MNIEGQKVFLFTPPFTQLNTPYPATAYLKGFLNLWPIPAYQADIGLEVILKIFSRHGLQQLFDESEKNRALMGSNADRIFNLREHYLNTIDPVIDFLQDTNPTLAHRISTGNYLPEASRFEQLDDLEWAFGTMGIRDKARHLATLYLEDISDFIIETIDPHFGFSRYAERLGRSASTFDELYRILNMDDTYIDTITLPLLLQKIEIEKPTLVAISVPFPGNLYSALRCSKSIKKSYSHIKIALGGGFANTELRSLSDTRVFEFVDFITLDDGEAPMICLLEYLSGHRPIDNLNRTFALIGQKVTYIDNASMPDYKQKDVGTPDYTDLPMSKYLSVIEIANPMHRLWSDGRWNKLTLAHGCYWGKCTFCDISLDYIKNYESTTATILVDRIVELIRQTGQTGFHFVDEAAPPALMKELALEIIKRKLTVVWWTNIRFEKSFTEDLCRLLALSGCIAISGGLEVASDRLLALIEKGVTVAQVAKVAHHFTKAGIMVHAYLMYGYPTQTDIETIDSLETVRQMMELGIIQSGFWHHFAMTAHSPVGMHPAKFNVKKVYDTIGTFANNDIVYEDNTGCNHDAYSDGLKKSLFNYMHGIGFDIPLQKWFDFTIAKTRIKPGYIRDILTSHVPSNPKPGAKIIWTGGVSMLQKRSKVKKGQTIVFNILIVNTPVEMIEIVVDQTLGTWLVYILAALNTDKDSQYTFEKFRWDYENSMSGSFEVFWQSEIVQKLQYGGLLVV